MDKKTVFLLGVSIAILAVMLYFVGIDKVIEALKIAKWEYIAIGIAMQIFTYYLYTLRWKILNDVANINVGIKKLLPMVMVGLAVNNITPSGRGGGEPVRAYILSREENYPLKETFATVVADRALDTFPFVVLAVMTIIGVSFYYNFNKWLIVVMTLAVIVIVIILAIIIYMSINPNFGKRVEGWIIGLSRRFYKKNSEEFEEKIHKTIRDFQGTMRDMIYNKKVMYYALPLSFVIWFFEIFRVYFVFLAFGANINPFVIGQVFIMASLVGMIPLLPGGVGAVDGIMVVFYSAAGVTASISMAATLIERLISFWMAIIIGLCILPYYGTSVLDKISGSSSDDKLEESSEDGPADK